jgi:hypothetical protein
VAGLGNTIDRILDSGSAVIIGRTRDGGAVVLTVLEGDVRHKTYCSNADELDEAMRAFDEYFEKS